MGALEEKPDEFSETINTLKEIYDNYNKGLSKVDSDTKVDLGNMIEAANEIFLDKIESLEDKKVLFNVSSDKKDQKEAKSDEIVINVDEFFESLCGLMETLKETEKEVGKNGPFERANVKKKKRKIRKNRKK